MVQYLVLSYFIIIFLLSAKYWIHYLLKDKYIMFSVFSHYHKSFQELVFIYHLLKGLKRLKLSNYNVLKLKKDIFRTLRFKFHPSCICLKTYRTLKKISLSQLKSSQNSEYSNFVSLFRRKMTQLHFNYLDWKMYREFRIIIGRRQIGILSPLPLRSIYIKVSNLSHKQLKAKFW